MDLQLGKPNRHTAYHTSHTCSYCSSGVNDSIYHHLVCLRLKTMGNRGFEAAAPRLWKALPDHLSAPKTLDASKKRLKTFLYRIKRAIYILTLQYIKFYVAL